jgi:hypothetical protein
MIKIGNGFFKHPENMEQECCFAVALINYFQLNKIKINETELFKKHLSAPYTLPDGGVDILLQPKQVEYLTNGEYNATLYHLICPWRDDNIENLNWKVPEIQKDEVKTILEEMIKNNQIQYSIPDVKRLAQPLGALGTLASIKILNSADNTYFGHAIVRLNPSIYHPRTHIDVDGNIYKMEDKDETIFVGCLEIKPART